MNPRPPLAPRAQWATRTPSERCQHRLQRTAAGGENETQAHADHAQAVGPSSCSLALPAYAYARQEIITRRRVFQKRLIAPVAVVSAGGGRHQHARRLLRGSQCSDEIASPEHASGLDRVLLL